MSSDLASVQTQRRDLLWSDKYRILPVGNIFFRKGDECRSVDRSGSIHGTRIGDVGIRKVSTEEQSSRVGTDSSQPGYRG